MTRTNHSQKHAHKGQIRSENITGEGGGGCGVGVQILPFYFSKFFLTFHVGGNPEIGYRCDMHRYDRDE